MYGSHSAALIIIVSIFSGSFGESFTCVGNPAPPSPTIPASFTALMIASFVFSVTGWKETVSYSPSFSTIMEFTLLPETVILGSIFFTVPETEL